jgi:DUF1680 family protein
VNLFINSNTSLNVNGKQVAIEQQNNYPWNGDLKFIINPNNATEFSLMLRIPGWAKGEAVPSDLYAFINNTNDKIKITVNGNDVDYAVQNGYAVIKKLWKQGDVVAMSLPMPVQQIASNKNIKGNIGKTALQRGPLVYCAEFADNNGKTSNIILPANTSFTTAFQPNLLNGVTVIKASIPVIDVDDKGLNVSTTIKDFTAIPYYSWANRGKGEMIIWMPNKITNLDIITASKNN